MSLLLTRTPRNRWHGKQREARADRSAQPSLLWKPYGPVRDARCIRSWVSLTRRAVGRRADHRARWAGALYTSSHCTDLAPGGEAHPSSPTSVFIAVLPRKAKRGLLFRLLRDVAQATAYTFHTHSTCHALSRHSEKKNSLKRNAY